MKSSTMHLERLEVTFIGSFTCFEVSRLEVISMRSFPPEISFAHAISSFLSLAIRSFDSLVYFAGTIHRKTDDYSSGKMQEPPGVQQDRNRSHQ